MRLMPGDVSSLVIREAILNHETGATMTYLRRFRN